MEQLLGGLLGGNPEEHQQAQNYVQRVEQGPPWEGFSGQEAQQHYRKVAGKVPPDVYRRAAEEAFQRLSPQERQQIIKQVKQHAQGRNAPRVQNWQENQNDPRQMADIMSHVQHDQPDLMNQLVDSVGGGNPLMKAALGGIAAMAMKQMMGGR